MTDTDCRAAEAAAEEMTKPQAGAPAPETRPDVPADPAGPSAVPPKAARAGEAAPGCAGGDAAGPGGPPSLAVTAAEADPATAEPTAPADPATTAALAQADAAAEEEAESAPPAEADTAPAGSAETPPPPRPSFADLGLSEALVRAVSEAGYRHPTPIQEQAIPYVLMGRDVLGCAQTGTGKTASFVLPMLDILTGSRAKARMPRSLILEPTRELALQVAENFVKYGKYLSLTHALLIGGESMEEQRALLDAGVDVLIATPGRLLDLFERGRVLLADCRLLVIDEADRMLDMGFIPDVERIVSLLPQRRQTLFFSATMAPEIRRLADAFLSNPKEITVAPPATVASTITTGLVYVQRHDKREALRRLIRREKVQNALIFCNRKVDVDILYRSLRKHGFKVGALHGDLEQPVRFATLNAFKAGELQLLVCSDVAARGLDIGGLSHVFNFDVPVHAEDYVHRIGRTGRAGREGRAFTIATVDDVRYVQAIEKLTGQPIPRISIDGLDPVSDAELAEAATRKRSRGGATAGGRDAAQQEGRAAATARGRETARPAGARGQEAARPAKEPRSPAAAGRAARPAEAARSTTGGRDRPASREEAATVVRGFGDAVPAFMLIRIPALARRAEEGEAAPEAPPGPARDLGHAGEGASAG